MAVFLNLAQVAKAIGVGEKALSRYRLPDPDVIVGPVNDRGEPVRGTVRGWKASTIEVWDAQRPSKVERPGMSLPEACAQLGVSRQALQQAITGGRLPAEKIAGRWTIDPDDLAVFSSHRG